MVDFYRINHIKHVIECDYDAWNDREVESKAKCEGRWLGAMQTILNLPVPTYSEPLPVAGEIDVAARQQRKMESKMNWNGNGYGNGFGGPQEDYYDRLNNTKNIEDRDPFIPEGRHRLVLCNLEEYMSKDKGPAVRASFEVLQSSCMQPGTFVTKLWFITKPSKFPTQATDADRLADFARKLKGEENPAAPMGASLRVLLRERAAEQLARGTVIDAYGRNTSKDVNKPYVDVTWTTVAQTEQDVIAQRTRIEQSGIAARFKRGGQQQQHQYAQQPQQQWSPNMQPMGYPNPAAQPPQQPQQWQGAPQPQPMPQQYQQPAAPPAQQPQQGAPAPQGGFLSQIPPNNGPGRW